MSVAHVTAGVDSVLLEREPPDEADISEVRHWIRVYTGLLEIADISAPATRGEELFARRVDAWRHRLLFWQARVRELSNPASR